MPPHLDNAARTHHPRGPSGAARGCEALLRPENHRVFRIIITHPRLRIDGKRDPIYRRMLPLSILRRDWERAGKQPAPEIHTDEASDLARAARRDLKSPKLQCSLTG